MEERPAIVPRRADTPILIGAAIFLVLAAAIAFSKGPDLIRGLLGLSEVAILAVVAVGDARTRRAPNRLVYPAILFAGLASLLLGGHDAVEALLGGVAAFLLLLVIALAGRGAMGLGDVKVGTLCGIVVGLHGVVAMLMWCFVAGAAVAAALLITRRRDRKGTVAFTPFLCLGTLAAMALNPLYLWG